MITVGRMAERYGLLPHQVAIDATTYDLMISDVLATYDRYEQQKASGKIDPSMYNLSQDEMKNIVDRARGK